MSWSLGSACEALVEAEVNAAIRQLAPACGYDVHEVARRLIEEWRYSIDELARLQRLVGARRVEVGRG
jgi:regulator of sirC expression with transglutaminase-like and TPR domain